MDRGSFIKSLITIILAPNLTGEFEAVVPYDKSNKSQVFDTDRIRFYSDEIDKFRIGDLIMSDMEDAALITCVIALGKGNNYAEARAIIRGQYQYKDINNFKILHNAFEPR